MCEPIVWKPSFKENVLHNIVRPPHLFKGSSKYWLPPPKVEGIWKSKKRGGMMVQGQVFLKGGVDTFPI